MPTLSASDYTQYLKFKAAAATPIRPAIQTRDNVTLSQSLLNANLLASQAALVVTPNTSVVSPLTPVVTDVSMKTVTDALVDIITGVAGATGYFTYTTSQAHGLSAGNAITINDLVQGTLNASPNGSKTVFDAPTATTFRVAVTSASGTSGAGNGRIAGRVYYTTSVAHGLLANDTVTITGLTTFNVTGKTVLAAPTATTFVVSDTTTGTAEAGQTATISGIVYYTTDPAHGIGAGQTNLSINGITGTTAFNLQLATVYRVPSATVFMIQSSASGDTVTSQTGNLTVTYFGNTNVVIRNNSRVQPLQVVQTRSTPDAKSTLSFAGTSGALSSSRVQQLGGLPTGFKNSQGTYTRVPQNAGWIQGGAGTVSSGPKRF